MDRMRSPIEDYIIKDINILGIEMYGGIITIIGTNIIINIMNNVAVDTGEIIEIKDNLDK